MSALPQSVVHPIDDHIGKPEAVKDPLELSFEFLLTHVLTAAIPLVEGAVVVHVPVPF